MSVESGRIVVGVETARARQCEDASLRSAPAGGAGGLDTDCARALKAAIGERPGLCRVTPWGSHWLSRCDSWSKPTRPGAATSG